MSLWRAEYSRALDLPLLKFEGTEEEVLQWSAKNVDDALILDDDQVVIDEEDLMRVGKGIHYLTIEKVGDYVQN